MHIGDRWEYKNSTPRTKSHQIVEIVGDTLPGNGLTYFIFQESTFYDALGIFVERYYQRQSGSKVYQYGFGNPGTDQLVYDFSFSGYDTIVTFPTVLDTTDIILLRREPKILFGVERQEWMFRIETFRIGVDDEYFIYIADSLGVSGHSSMITSYTLVNAHINGIDYGAPTDVPRTTQRTAVNYALYQNYPNPFNPGTFIQYNISKSAHVTLVVFNVLGQKIAVLVDELKNSGSHEVSFDASSFAGGIYFYRLSADGFMQTRKMILQK